MQIFSNSFLIGSSIFLHLRISFERAGSNSVSSISFISPISFNLFFACSKPCSVNLSKNGTSKISGMEGLFPKDVLFAVTILIISSGRVSNSTPLLNSSLLSIFSLIYMVFITLNSNINSYKINKKAARFRLL